MTAPYMVNKLQQLLSGVVPSVHVYAFSSCLYRDLHLPACAKTEYDQGVTVHQSKSIDQDGQSKSIDQDGQLHKHLEATSLPKSD